MGARAKRFWQNLPFAVSGAVLLALWGAGNSKKKVLLAAVLGLMAAAVLALAPAVRPWLQKRLRPFTVGAGLLAAGVGGVLFCGNWHFQNLADRLGLSGGVLVAVLGFFAAMLALPAAVALCAFLLEEKQDDSLNAACQKLCQSRVLLGALLALAAGFLVVQGYFAFASRYIWADEVFTLKLIRHSVPRLVALTAVDVHPPLYYLIVKLFAALTPFWPTVAAAKLCSLLPVALLVVWAAVRGVRDAARRFAYGLFAVCVAGLPSLTNYSLEIRMYSWGLLFVTLCFAAGRAAAENGRRRDWAAFVAFGLAAAYTHYFACVAVALAYLVLLGCCLKNKKGGAWLAAAGVTVAAYLPWLIVLLGQLRTVKEGYWIQPITGEDIAGYWRFAFGGGLLWVVALAVLTLLAEAVLRRKVTVRQDVWPLALLLTPAWVAAVGLVASALIRPVFMERYLLPALGCLWLGCALAVALLPAVRIKPLAAAVLAAFAVGNLREFTVRERYEAGEAAGAYAILDTLPSDAVLVSTAVRVEEKLAGMTERDNYVWGDTLGSLPKSVYDNLYDFTDFTEREAAVGPLADWVKTGRVVCFVETQSAAGAAREAAALAGLRAEAIGACSLGEPLTFWRLTLSQ